jgi:L-lactate dehydrogenase complex protein LldG
MSDPRAAILGRLSQALGHQAAADAPAVLQRIGKPERGPQPQWNQSMDQRFLTKLTRVAGTHASVASNAELVAAVTDYIEKQNLPQRVCVAPHPLLAHVEWPQDWQVVHGRTQGDDRVGLTVAFCGIAESGSLMLLSGPESPTTLNFLPDDFLCLLPESRIVPRLEDAWALLRAERGSMPRAANIITGPSRTADVEQTIQLGAHGPRRLHVLLWGARSES